MRARTRTVMALVMLVMWVTPITHARPHETISVSRASSRTDWTALRTVLDSQAQWYATIEAQQRWYATAASRPVIVTLQPGPAPLTMGACGGDLPSCAVLACESGGNLTAQNPHSTASGKWQILDSTWAGYGGYSRAMYAPEDVQDDKARQLYAGGRGRSQWSC